MAFSDWQQRRLRARLSLYQKRQGYREFGSPLPWKTVDGRILSYVDADVGGKDGERLRQFVEGVPVSKGSTEMRFPVPEDHRLEAIRDFLMHENVRYLEAYELDEESSLQHPPFALLDYYQSGIPNQDDNDRPMLQLDGSYEAITWESSNFRRSSLSVKAMKDSRLFEITEQVAAYRHTYADPWSENKRNWHQFVRPENRKQFKTVTGWALENGNQCLLIFLKDAYDNKVYNYLLVDRHRPGSGNEPVSWMAVLSYGPGLRQFVPELHRESDLADEAEEKLVDELINEIEVNDQVKIFRRTEAIL